MAANWYHLPAEICIMIWDSLISSHHGKARSEYTMISRQWRDFFQPRILSRLFITDEKRREIGIYGTPEVQQWIKSIVHCPWDNSGALKGADFGISLGKLMKVLAEWAPRGTHGSGHLALKILVMPLTLEYHDADGKREIQRFPTVLAVNELSVQGRYVEIDPDILAEIIRATPKLEHLKINEWSYQARHNDRFWNKGNAI